MDNPRDAVRGLSSPAVPSIYPELLKLLAAGERVALARVIQLTGSGPRSAGAKMLVSAGEALGSIGGGLLEAEVKAWAKEVLASGRPLCRTMSLSHDQAAESGMICGGQVELLVEPFDGANVSDLHLFSNMERLMQSRQRGFLITAVQQSSHQIQTTHVLLDDEGSRIFGHLEISDEPAMIDRARKRSQAFLWQMGTLRFFIEPLAPLETVYVFGAGHIAESLVPLCKMVGFQVMVVDDREDFANPTRFPTADEILVPDSFSAAMDDLSIGRDGYVVIVTRGHAGDQTVLTRALRTNAAYIGMIGSRSKRDAIYRVLGEEGFSPVDLKRVRCPIGVAIGADTPQEIAVSIVAELIGVRAGMKSSS